MTQIQCPKCNAVFGSRDEFRDHARKCKGGQGGSGEDPKPEYKCGVCGQIFSSSRALGAHSLKCKKEEADDLMNGE